MELAIIITGEPLLGFFAWHVPELGLAGKSRQPFSRWMPRPFRVRGHLPAISRSWPGPEDPDGLCGQKLGGPHGRQPLRSAETAAPGSHFIGTGTVCIGFEGCAASTYPPALIRTSKGPSLDLPLRQHIVPETRLGVGMTILPNYQPRISSW
jgi:hypothetical protein